MAKNGYFIVELKASHLNWGLHRKTPLTRGPINGEGYLPIPRSDAMRLNIFNSNGPGPNIYQCNSTDSFLKNKELKACGSTKAGDIYAKNLQGNGNLKLLGDWYQNIGATIGTKIKIEFKNNIITLTKV